MDTANKKRKIIGPCLWFDGNAEQAVDFYVSVFEDSRKGKVARYPKGGPMPEGTVLTVQFQLEGDDFLALNGGPEYKFNEAVSFMIYCDTQEDIDYYWGELTRGGEEGVCGWLKDKFGLSWQVVPSKLIEFMSTGDAEQTSNVMQSFMKMKKFDIKKLEDAYNGVDV